MGKPIFVETGRFSLPILYPTPMCEVQLGVTLSPSLYSKAKRKINLLVEPPFLPASTLHFRAHPGSPPFFDQFESLKIIIQPTAHIHIYPRARPIPLQMNRFHL